MKEKNRDVFNKVLYLSIVVIVFGFAFWLLIRNQYSEVKNGDISGKFAYHTIEDKQIVAQDMSSIYPKYYVAFIYQNGYIVHSFNYYNTASQYELEFNRLLNIMVDYNAKNNMIRCFDSKGFGNYEYVKNNFGDIVGNENIKIY